MSEDVSLLEDQEQSHLKVNIVQRLVNLFNKTYVLIRMSNFLREYTIWTMYKRIDVKTNCKSL